MPAVSSSTTEGGPGGAGEQPREGEPQQRRKVDVIMPQMGVSVAEGTIAVWHKRVGDWVAAEETVCEITTDKIDTDIPAPSSGRVVEILAAEDETLPGGSVVARIETGVPAGEARPDEQLGAGQQAGAGQQPGAGELLHAGEQLDVGEQPAPAAADAAPAGSSAPAPSDRARYSPVVLRIARSEGIDLAQVHGTGRGGRVRKQDVLAFLAQRAGGEPQEAPRAAAQAPLHIDSPYEERLQGAAPAGPPDAAGGSAAQPAPGERAQRLSRMRRSIAEHMLRSQ